MTLTQCIHPSPVGPLSLVSDGTALVRLEFAHDEQAVSRERTVSRVAARRGAGLETACHASDAILDAARRELDAYFAGRRRGFEVPVAPRGTPFQERVWRALLDIPYGVTRSYGQVAAAIGSPTAFRAVGLANGRNPIAIVVPCHRVIGADGSLTGYGGGEHRKRLLLELERGTLHAPA